MAKYYKAFRKDGLTLHGRPAWPQPTEDGPGEWLPALEGEPVACEHGYHLMREQDLPLWPGWHLYEVEVDGEVVESDDKVVTTARCRLVRKLAWGETELLTWLADCAEHVLPHFEQSHPDDLRPRRCIGALREYVAGRIPIERLLTHAVDAAHAAASAAASAAFSAAFSAHAAVDAAHAAHAAAERQWQTQRMAEIAGR